MTRLMTTLAAFGLMIAQPAFAMDSMMKCDEASMMKVQGDLDAMTGDAMKMQKETATKEVDMAKEAMKMNEADKCATHLDNAMKAMKGM